LFTVFQLLASMDAYSVGRIRIARNPVSSKVETVEVDMREAHEASLDLLTYLETADIDPVVAPAALVMTAGRMMAPKPLSAEEEIAFIQLFMDWCGTYFTPRSTH
jgi:hypothetical protein